MEQSVSQMQSDPKQDPCIGLSAEVSHRYHYGVIPGPKREIKGPEWFLILFENPEMLLLSESQPVGRDPKICKGRQA